jgi:DUF4097 and DUF4098 domain-containing protein YvlB
MEYLDMDRKSYLCTMRLGRTYDTQDITGALTEEAPEDAVNAVTEEAVRAAFAGFAGAVEQFPPMYSARKVDGRKLYVKYAASGFRALPNLNKQLTVLLPETLRLDDLKISVASGEVEADGINADEIHLQSASGRIALRQVGHAEKIRVETASGGVAVAAGDADSLKINTASGQVIVNAIQADEVSVNTASGAVTLQFADAPDRIDADSVSGNVTIRLPREAGFTADVDSLSGVVRCQQDADRRGDDTYVYGNGRCRIEADTVSGNLLVEINADAGEKEV